MAFTITDQELAVLFRITTDPDGTLPAAQSTAIKFLRAGAEACILAYAPDAPDSVHDTALVRLGGFLYDADPAEIRVTNPMAASGAESVLAMWRKHRIGVIGAADAILPPLPPGQGGNVPDPPGDGHYILTSNDGVLTWVEFPSPS